MNGGPWGGGPWGGPPRGGGQPPRGGPRPPNVEEFLRRGQDRFRRLLPQGSGSGRGLIAVAVVAIVALWFASGVYRVLADEQGVVTRFGRYAYTTAPGLHFHWPYPIEAVYRPQVTRVNRLDIGYRAGVDSSITGRTSSSQDVQDEASMLTGDENIVELNFTVLWLINDAKAYLFNIRNPDQTVKVAAESAMREVVGHTEASRLFIKGREQIESETQKLLQDILDSYGAGITITEITLQKVAVPAPVIDAFNDVQRALADQERKRNDAETYSNGILPVARGESVRIVQEAEAYRAQVVAKAQGESQRFLSVLGAYQASPDITARRLYIETLEDVLKSSDKIVLDKSAQGSGVLPYLPLPPLKPAGKAAGPSGDGGAGSTATSGATTGSPTAGSSTAGGSTTSGASTGDSASTGQQGGRP